MGNFRNILSAKISGNVGAMNFRRRGADTVVAERSYENRSAGSGATEAQRAHRSRLANLVALFREIKAIEARAWEGKKPYVSDFNMLTSINLATSPIFLTKEEATLSASVVAPYIVSRGSLPALDQHYEGNEFHCGIKCSNAFDIADATIADVSSSIIALNADWKDGDKLSICCMDQKRVSVSGVLIPKVEVRYIEFTLDTRNGNPIDTIPGYSALEFDKSADGEIIANLGGDAAFAIHSRKVAGYLQTSEQRVIIKDTMSAIYLTYTNEAQKIKAMESYGYQPDVLLTPFSEEMPTGSFPAEVSAIMFAGAPAINGHTYTAGGNLEISGTDLADKVIVKCNGVIYTPMVNQNDLQGYTLTSNGVITVEVNNAVIMTFTIRRPAGQQKITSIKIDGTTYSSKIDNLSKAGFTDVAVEVFGENLGTLTATGSATLTNLGGDETHRTATMNARSGQGGYALLCGGEIFCAGTADYNDNGGVAEW